MGSRSKRFTTAELISANKVRRKVLDEQNISVHFAQAMLIVHPTHKAMCTANAAYCGIQFAILVGVDFSGRDLSRESRKEQRKGS
jgi:hypothetical protein